MNILGKIEKSLSSKALTSADHLLGLNREIIPILRALRSAVNQALGYEIRIPAMVACARPSGGTTTVYASSAELVTAGVLNYLPFNIADFPATLNGRTRNIYLVIGGCMGFPAAATSVDFELYNTTDGEPVTGTQWSTSSLYPERSSELGPITVSDDAGSIKTTFKAYAIYSKRTGGTVEDALWGSAELIIRYQ